MWVLPQWVVLAPVRSAAISREHDNRVLAFAKTLI